MCSISRVMIRAAIAALLLSAGCAPEAAAPTPAVPPLVAETWHVHEALGVPLPGVVSRGVIAGELTEIVADSAHLAILDGGRYLVRAWTSVHRGQRPPVSTAWSEEGSWVGTGTGYVFTSAAGESRGVVRDASSAVQSLRLRLGAELTAGDVVLRRGRPRTLPVGRWRADAIAERLVPATMYVFTGVIEDGREISAHFVVDSAFLELRATGRYLHRVWYTEWEGEVNGPPHTIRVRFYHGDFGTWRLAAGQVELESGWFQNHRMTGQLDDASVALRIPHGLTPGDERVVVRYRTANER